MCLTLGIGETLQQKISDMIKLEKSHPDTVDAMSLRLVKIAQDTLDWEPKDGSEFTPFKYFLYLKQEHELSDIELLMIASINGYLSGFQDCKGGNDNALDFV